MTVTPHEFQVGEDCIHGRLAISIENQTRELLWYHGCGSTLSRLGSPGRWQGVWGSICTLVIEEVSIGPGQVLDTTQVIFAHPSEDATGWTAPIDGTYRLHVFLRNAREVLSTAGVASNSFVVAAEHP